MRSLEGEKGEIGGEAERKIEFLKKRKRERKNTLSKTEEKIYNELSEV